MKVKIAISVLLFFTASAVNLNSQIYSHPNIGLKSHETLEITKVEVTPQNTTVFLRIENKIPNGYFCADRNIFIINGDGSRCKLASSSGIPVCPDTYKFRSIGEKLEFILTFPPINQNTKWIDLIEDCKENCFSFYGVTLDSDLNKKIDDAFLLVEKGEPATALISFVKISESIENKNSGAEGLVYITIVKLSREMGNTVKAAEWYNKLKLSRNSRMEFYIKHLNSQGIIY
jgi:hypothetical protein